MVSGTRLSLCVFPGLRIAKSTEPMTMPSVAGAMALFAFA
jgi:hypothetical protein